MSEQLQVRLAAGPQGTVAFATLNSEATLNSLTLEMIDALQPKLREWARDPNVKAVVLDGAGEKAFCAGGDVRRLHQAITSKQIEGADTFFEKEYTLDYSIHVFPKPLIVFGHGIVMGGGLGIFVGASHRVVSEATKIAMPEITIGLYPDVAGSYFLNHMPDGLGLFLGLTGARLNAEDCMSVGLANTFVARAYKADLYAALESLRWGGSPLDNKVQVSRCLRDFEAKSFEKRPNAELLKRYDVIKVISAGRNVEEFAERLRAAAANDPWIAAAAKTFFAGSPTSARVIFEQLRRSRGLTLEECFAMELALSQQFLRHPDLVEGIRALLIDKDMTPRWSKARTADVSDELVDTHFRWPHAGRPNPLIAGLAKTRQELHS